MPSYNFSDLSNAEAYQILSSAISPRPICFASTIDKEGNVNLSPFSFFNLMSSNPPICVFSPVNRGRDGSAKNTLENLLEVPEVVINIVNYPMVQQMSLASTEYPKGTNEFIKAGFTAINSQIVKPPRVQESPVQLECKVNQIIPLGKEGGAGNIVIAEVLYAHIDANILDQDGKIVKEETKYFGYNKDRLDLSLYFYDSKGMLIKKKERFGVFDGDYRYIYKYRK